MTDPSDMQQSDQQRADGIPDVRGDLPSIPVLATIFHPHHPHAAPDVFHEGSTYSGLERVADTLFHAMREERFLTPPRGVLYMEQGAYDLTEVFQSMWDTEEAYALRAMSRGIRYETPGRAIQKAANDVLHKTWAAFLWDHGVTE